MTFESITIQIMEILYIFQFKIQVYITYMLTTKIFYFFKH
jgi:hypothetical protein